MNTAVTAPAEDHATAVATFRAACDRRARRAMLKAAERPTAQTHCWRVLRNGRDLGVAFTLDGAGEAVDRLRREYLHLDRLRPHFVMRGCGGKGALPFEQCVIGR